MGEQVKYIVSELQKPPFSKHYNLITLDALTGEQLLQVGVHIHCTVYSIRSVNFITLDALTGEQLLQVGVHIHCTVYVL